MEYDYRSLRRFEYGDLLVFLRDLTKSNLLKLTTLACIDGNILSLAMSESLKDPFIIIVTAFTCIAGIGAWTAAIEEYSGKMDWYSRKKLIATALISIAAVTLTCFIGSMIRGNLNLGILRYFSAVVVFLIGLEIAGVRIPENIPKTPIPITLAVLSMGIILEIMEVIA